jgi:DNA replication and repair protein RecF
VQDLYVKSIKLINFRNYETVKIDLSPKLNLFLGNNAQGKTNLLESIYIAAIGKSYRLTKDKELINFEKEKAYIGVEVESSRGSRLIEFKFQRDAKKIIRINKLELERLSELTGNLNVVIFAPEDLSLVKSGPSERRAFLDTEISQIKPRYRHNINMYGRVLLQRNKLLKFRRSTRIEQLDPWDIQLAKIGSDIMIERLRFTDKLSGISQKVHENVSGGKERLDIRYRPSFPAEELSREKLAEKYYSYLCSSRSSDLEKGNTEYGPHRDDIEIEINGTSCRTFGSQGQQRTAALSLKLAEVELIKSEVGEYPVLLLDDVLSELDSERRKYLISTFKGVQTIVTSTDDVDLLENEHKSIFRIDNGKVFLDR